MHRCTIFATLDLCGNVVVGVCRLRTWKPIANAIPDGSPVNKKNIRGNVTGGPIKEQGKGGMSMEST